MTQEKFKTFVIKNELFVWGSKNDDYIYNPNEDPKDTLDNYDITKEEIEANLEHYRYACPYLFK